MRGGPSIKAGAEAAIGRFYGRRRTARVKLHRDKEGGVMIGALRQRALAVGAAARIGAQAAVISQVDRARDYLPSRLPALPFAGR